MIFIIVNGWTYEIMKQILLFEVRSYVYTYVCYFCITRKDSYFDIFNPNFVC